jgi:DinB superfamily
MKRCFLLIVAAGLAGALTVHAQDNPLSSDAKRGYESIKSNLTRMAEKMPEENYGFQPTPEIRTFGQLVAHVADAQARTCSAVNGEPKNVNAGSKTSKADLVAALKESFSICDAAFNALTDASAVEMVEGRRGSRAKLSILNGVLTHSNEEYGYMAVYLRLKGVVPPSSEGR